MFFRILNSFKIPRQPDFVIGDASSPYMLRWYVIPRNKYFNVYLHKVLKSDDPIYHDHPWWSLGIILRGSYYEHTPAGYGQDNKEVFPPGKVKFRNGEYLHWLEVKDGPVWTLFITGPKFKEWGFLCPKGWRHYKEVIKHDGPRGNEGVQCPE
jgi:hypothetical protein